MSDDSSYRHQASRAVGQQRTGASVPTKRPQTGVRNETSYGRSLEGREYLDSITPKYANNYQRSRANDLRHMDRSSD
jgi:hypothetical protein